MQYVLTLLMEVLAVLCAGGQLLASSHGNNTWGRRIATLTAFLPVWTLTKFLPYWWGWTSWRYQWWAFFLIMLPLGIIGFLFSLGKWEWMRKATVFFGACLAVLALIDHPWTAELTLLHLGEVAIIGSIWLLVAALLAQHTGIGTLAKWAMSSLLVLAVLAFVGFLFHKWTGSWFLTAVAIIGALLTVAGAFRNKGRGWLLSFGIGALAVVFLFGALPGFTDTLHHHVGLAVLAVVAAASIVAALFLRGRRIRWFLLAGGIAAAIVVGVMSAASHINLGSTPAAAADVPKPSSISDINKVPDGFCTTLAAKYGFQVQTLDDGTKVPVLLFDAVDHPERRLWDDATNVPLVPSQTNEAEQAANCVYPTQAGMGMNAFGPQTIDGVNIAKVNASWIAAQGDPNTAISTWAENCRTAQTNKNTKEIEACADSMSHMAYLLGFLQPLGVHQESNLDWYYSASYLAVGKVPTFKLNQGSYSGYFVEFGYTTKARDACVKFGYNVGKDKQNGGDQRLVQIKCTVPKPTSSSTGTTTQAGCKQPCTPNNGCTSCGGSTPSPSPSTCPCPGSSALHQTVPVLTAGTNQGGDPNAAPPYKSPDPVNTGSPQPPATGGGNGGATAPPNQSGAPESPHPIVSVSGDPGGM